MLIKTLISKKLSKLIKIAIGLPGMGGEGSKLPRPYKGWQFKYEKIDPFTPLESGGLTGDLIMGGWSFSLPLSLYKTRLDDVQKQLHKTFDEVRSLNDEILRVISSSEADRPAYVTGVGWSYPHDFDSMAWNYLSRIDNAISELVESSIKVLQPHLKQLNYITRYAPPGVSVFDGGNPQLDWRLYTLATLMKDDLVISTIFQGPLPEHIKYDLIDRFSHARLPSLLVALPEIINLEKRILSEDLYDKAAKGGEVLVVDPKGSEGIIDLYVARLKPVRRDGNTYLILQTRSPTREELADLTAEIFAKSFLAKQTISELKARDTTGELNRAFAEKGGSLDYFINYFTRYEQLGSMADRLYSSQRMPEPVLDLAKSVAALAASDFEKISHKFSSILHKVYTETMLSPEPGIERELLPLFRLLRPGYLLDITEPNKGNLHVVASIGSSPVLDLPAFQHLSRISLERYVEPVSLVRRTPLGKWWLNFKPRR